MKTNKKSRAKAAARGAAAGAAAAPVARRRRAGKGSGGRKARRREGQATAAGGQQGGDEVPRAGRRVSMRWRLEDGRYEWFEAKILRKRPDSGAVEYGWFDLAYKADGVRVGQELPRSTQGTEWKLLD